MVTLISLLLKQLNVLEALTEAPAGRPSGPTSSVLDRIPIPDKLPDVSSLLNEIFSNPYYLLVIAAVLVIGGIIAAFVARAAGKRGRLRKDALRIPVDKLTPEDLGIEKYKNGEHHIPRESDEYLVSLLDGVEPRVLVVGKTGSGKTRTVYEAVKGMNGYVVLAPKHHTIPQNKLKAISYLRKKKVFLFLDDLDKYVKKVDIAMLIEQLKKNAGALAVLATCRGGDPLELVEKTEPSFLMQFDDRTRIELRDLTPEEEEALASSLDRDWSPTAYNRTPGSVAVDLPEMKVRYKNASSGGKTVVGLLKMLRSCFIHTYKESVVKKLFQATFEGDPESKANWNDALTEMVGNELVTRKEKELSIYDAYLEDDFIDDYTPGEEGYQKLEDLLIREKDAEGLFSMGVFYYTRDRLDKSIDVLENAAAFDPNHVNARICLGDAYEKKDMVEEAITQYEEVLKINPGNPQVHNRLGLMYYEQDMMDAAIEAFGKTIGINPGNVEAHYHLGLIHEKREEMEDAILEYREAIRLAPSHLDAHRNLAFIYNKQGLLEEAIREFREVAAINPEDAEVHYILASAYSESGKVQEAIAEYVELVRINPDDAKAQYSLAVNYYKTGRLEAAVEAFKEVIRINPDDVRSHFNLGLTYYKKDMIEDAVKEYEEVLKLKPGYSAAYYNLALCYAKKGMTDEAIDGFKEAIRNNPNHPEAHRNLALAYNKKNMFDAAVEEFREAIRIRPNDPTSHGGLAMAYHKKGMTMEARKEFRIYEQLKARLSRR
ncbi:MAG: tetratricopeptide repeat protein [Candidatus Brocadiales bacterium]|nr:tetratricopeptide repeat protein [Candidatus Bathyanammoxibius amoris]